MCDFGDHFEEDFGNDDFMDEDTLEDSLEGEMDEPFTNDAELEDKPNRAESQGDDLPVDPFFIGGGMGFGYEEGLRERKRRKRKRLSDDSE